MSKAINCIREPPLDFIEQEHPDVKEQSFTAFGYSPFHMYNEVPDTVQEHMLQICISENNKITYNAMNTAE